MSLHILTKLNMQANSFIEICADEGTRTPTPHGTRS